MKERPILFNGEMVRAILAGTKTQTRRIAKPVKHPDLGNLHDPSALVLEHELQHVINRACPYGQPGDRLWVRETWRGVVEISPPGAPIEYGVARYVPDQQHCRRVEYAATQERDAEPWRPSIHMPRWASRILLEIVSVRVERLQDIGEDDALAEGITFSSPVKPSRAERMARDAFADLWESINGAGSWVANPWVWVLEFKRTEGGTA